MVEIGVYEGASALLFCDALPAGAELHLIDPFPTESGAALFPAWRGNPLAAKIVVWRGARGTGLTYTGTSSEARTSAAPGPERVSI